MRIGSLNVRGLGNDAKKDDAATFWEKNNFDFCGLQETKMEVFTDRDGSRIWKEREIRWSVEGTFCRSGGLVTCWDERKFTCVSSWSLGGAVIVNGWCKATREDLCIINVYAPCDRLEKARLWDQLGLVVTQVLGVCLCIIGDFNSIL